jgi:hypothetical protein
MPCPLPRLPNRALKSVAWALAPGLTLHSAVIRQGVESAVVPRLVIRHEASACVSARRYSRLDACFSPADSVARARVYFRAAGTSPWFYVDMTGEPPCLTAVLPRPKKSLAAVEYRLVATNRDSLESATPVYTASVTADGRCAAGRVAPVVETKSVVIGSPSGGPPPGCLSGGGVSPLLIAGSLVGAGGVAAVVATRKGAASDPNRGLATRPVPSRPGTTSGISRLSVEGGRGRVVLDGAQMVLVAPETQVLGGSWRPGPHRIEATLVAGDGRPGTWTFDLSSLPILPGSLALQSGDGVVEGSEARFRLLGRAGERVSLTFEIGGAP